MTQQDEVRDALLDHDGSGRDVNFQAPTWIGVRRFVAALADAFPRATASDEDGGTIPLLGPHSLSSVLAVETEFRHAIFDGGAGVLKRVQVFVGSEPDGTPFVELTFFPEDLDPTPHLVDRFTDWVTISCRQLGARRYFVRYEGASWKFDDIGPQSGVFLVADVGTDA